MALYGNSKNDFDISLIPAADAVTTTSQYKCALISASFTANIPTSTATAWQAVGIFQEAISAGSDITRVRLAGISKAVCGASVAAGEPVRCIDAAGASTTARGCIESITWATSITTATIGNYVNVLGVALERGSTNTVISVALGVGNGLASARGI